MQSDMSGEGERYSHTAATKGTSLIEMTLAGRLSDVLARELTLGGFPHDGADRETNVGDLGQPKPFDVYHNPEQGARRDSRTSVEGARRDSRTSEGELGQPSPFDVHRKSEPLDDDRPLATVAPSPSASLRDPAEAHGDQSGETPSHQTDAGQAAESRATSSVPGPTRKRSVLVIASRFPPVASVGAIRVRKFVKYLRRYGWNPVVITGAMRQGAVSTHDVRRATDLDSLRDLPADVPVYRLSPVLDNWPGHLARYCSNKLAQIIRPTGIDAHRLAGSLKWRFQRLHDVLAFPDRGIWRLPSAVRLALALHRRYHFDAIFSSGMPFSDHLIGLVLQSLLRRPWLVDFRDPWVEYIHWQQWQSDLGGVLTRAAESAVVGRAARVISVNEHMTRRFVSRYPEQPTCKFVTIQNGFDPADCPNSPGSPPRTHFRLLYAGSLYKTRSPQAMLAGYERFLQSVPGSRERARFEFAGRAGPFIDELTDLTHDGTVQYLGMLPHAAALRAMSETDVNVIILPKIPGSENDTTAKIYECLGSNRPVLAAVPLDGAAAAVLRRFDGVWLCDPDDVDEQARAITEIYRRWLAGDDAVRRPIKQMWEFTREHQAGQLAACLDSTQPRRRRTQGIMR